MLMSMSRIQEAKGEGRAVRAGEYSNNYRLPPPTSPRPSRLPHHRLRWRIRLCTVDEVHRAGLLYIPAEVKDEVLEWYGSTNFKELKTLAQPFLSESIRVLFEKMTVIDQFVYVMRDCCGQMQWSDFYGHNEFRASCLAAQISY